MSQTFTVKNFKGVREITLRPAGSLVVIAGSNGAGKSSFIDAFVELFDPKGIRLTPRPIRAGEDEARAEFTDTELGVRVVRTWKQNDSGKLEVFALDGAKYSKPTEMVAQLTGGLIFDPVAFLNLDEKKQRDELLAKVDLPFDLNELGRQKAGAEERRLEAGREVKRLRGALASLSNPLDAPAEEVSAKAIIDEIQAAQGLTHSYERERIRLDEMSAESTQIAAQIADLTGKLELLGSAIKAQSAVVLDLPPVPDLALLREKLASVEDINHAVRARREYAKIADECARAEMAQAAAQRDMDAIEARKRDGLSAATFPVDGLNVTDEGVTFNGIPFSQVNTAARRKVAFAIATAGEPKLKLVIIKDGDLLDGESLAGVRALAEERHYTVLAERDRDDSRSIGFTIEDGALA